MGIIFSTIGNSNFLFLNTDGWHCLERENFTFKLSNVKFIFIKVCPKIKHTPNKIRLEFLIRFSSLTRPFQRVLNIE